MLHRFFRKLAGVATSWEYVGATSLRAQVTKTVTIIPHWSENIKIEAIKHGHDGVQSVVGVPYTSIINTKADGSIELNDFKLPKDEQDSFSEFTVHVPERFSFDIESHGSKIELRNKVEGNVKLFAPNGKVVLGKVRGERIHVSARDSIDVQTNVEGSNVKLSAGLITVQRLMGSEVLVNAAEVCDLKSVYVDSATVSSPEIKLGTVHGKIKVYGNTLQVDGIDGGINATCVADINVSFDTPHHEECVLKSLGGNIRLVTAECTKSCGPQVVHAEARHIVPDETAFEEVTKEQTGRGVRVQLKSVGRHCDSTKTMQSCIGKINIEEAAKGTFGRVTNDAPAIYILAPEGKIRLEESSWMKRIEQKFK